MATTAGSSYCAPDFDYCYINEVADETTTLPLKALQAPTMKVFLTKWGIKFIGIESIVKQKFFDAVQTLFLLNNVPNATQELMESAEVGELIETEPPQWVKEFRERNVSEADIREIISKVGFEPKVMAMASEQVIKKLTLGSPAKRLIESMIERLNHTEVKVIRPDTDVRQILNSDGNDDIFQEQLSRPQLRFHREEEHRVNRESTNPVRFNEDCNPPVNRSFQDNQSIPDMNQSQPVPTTVNVNETYPRLSLGSYMDRVKPKLPTLPNFVQGMDAWGWLQTVKRQLSLERCHDDDKLYVLQKAMAYEFLPLAKKLDGESHTSDTYITALERALRNPACISQATAEFHSMKWNFNMHPIEFIRKLEQMVLKVKGEPSQNEFIQDILIRVPAELKDTLIRTRSISNIDDLTAAMVNEYNIELRKRTEKSTERVAVKRDSFRRDDERRDMRNSNSNGAVKQPLRCYNCNRLGHSSRECRQPKRTYPNAVYHSNSNAQQSNAVNHSNAHHTNAVFHSKSNEKFSPANLRMANANATSPTYGQSSQTPKESNNFINEDAENVTVNPVDANPKLARAPVADYSFMTNENEKPVELITRIDDSTRNFPTVRLTLCYPNRDVIKIGDVLVDTGACTACIDYTLSMQLKAYILSSNVAVRGIIADSFQAVEGAAYAILKHPKMQTSKIIKFQVMRNLEPLMVLGNRFADVFFIGMVNHGGRYQVNLKETIDGSWHTPELMFRFCTPEESIGLIDKPEVPNTILTQEKQNFLDSLQLPFSSWSEDEEESIPKVTQQEIEQKSFINELSLCHAFDNVIPIYFKMEQSELSLAERLINRMDPKLSLDQRNELLTVLMQFPEVFSQNKADLGLVPWQRWPIKIDIGDNVVPYQRPYPCTIEKRKEYQKIIADLMKNDIIEPSDAEGGSPALLIGKPDGSFRLLNDLRAVNRLTKVIFHPMPRVDDCLEAIRGANYFNMFDLYQGYFQIEIPPSERGKTVFVTPDGKYQYKRLPMGLACAPFEFQRLMNTVLHGLNYTECLGYFDDIPVIGKSWNELLTNTELVLDRLRDWNLKIKTDKCKFGVTELLLLGHLVNGNGIRPDPDKVSALKKLPYPTSVRQLQSQLGCFNYFSRYIPKFSKLAAPLYRLVSKERKFKMLRQDHETLDKLKESLIETTMLVHFDPELRKKITVDASDIAVGGILLQEDADQSLPEGFESLRDLPIEKVKHWKPMYFFSQKLAKHQESYSVSEKECLAVLIAIKKFRHYFEGDEFLVETDHHALCQLPKLKFKNQRLERWTIILSSFKFKVVYTKGDKHSPDCLSRYQSEWDHRKLLDPEKEYIENLFLIKLKDLKSDKIGEELNESEIHNIQLSDSSLKQSLMNYLYHYQTNENWKLNLVSSQREDNKINDIILELISDPKSKLHEQYLFVNNLLFHKPTIGHDLNRVVINEKVLKKLFDEEHSSPLGGHFGVEKTFLQIARRFWMNSLYEKIKELCANCQICYLSKSTNCTYAEPALKPIPESVLERLEMDAQGPITFKGGAKKVILVLIDTLTRFVYAKLLPNQNSSTVIKFLDEYFSLFGFPSVIQTDRGRNFLSGEVEHHLKAIGIAHEVSNSYHPQSQGTVERVNRTIAERLRSSIMNKELVDLKSSLEDAVLAINSSVHKIHRFTPYFLVFGKYLRKPVDLQLQLETPNDNSLELCRNLARERLLKQQQYYQNRLQSTTKRNPYQIGDLCYVKNCAPSLGTTKKLVNKFFGPYFVLGVQKGSVLLVNPQTEERFTANLELTKPHIGHTPENLTELRAKLINNLNENQLLDHQNENEHSINHSNDYNQDYASNEHLSEEDLNPNSATNSENCDNQYDSDTSTIADDKCALEFNQTNKIKLNHKKKRVKYKTANREIMDNTIITDNLNEINGPLTRKRKIISVNLITIKYIDLANFKICAKNHLTFSRVKSESNYRLLLERQRKELPFLFSIVTPLSSLDPLVDFVCCSQIDLNQFLINFFNSFGEFPELQFSRSTNFEKLNQISPDSLSEISTNSNFLKFSFLNVELLLSSSLIKLLVLFGTYKLPLIVRLFDCLTANCYQIVNFIQKLCSCVSERIVILIEMPGSQHSTDSNDSFVSIVSSTTFGEQLAANLAEILRNPPPPINAPLIDLTSEKSDNEDNSEGWGDWQNDYVNNPSDSDSEVNFVFNWPTDRGEARNQSTEDLTQEDKFARLRYRNPLPEHTAFGLRTVSSEKDCSPYPPPDANQRRFNCEFPAPKPPQESERHSFNQIEFFKNARSAIQIDIKKSEEDKAWFDTFIKEKIQFNVADTDLSKIKFGSLRKGFSASQVIHPDLSRLKDLVTCNLCEQIAINPKYCSKCHKIYCFGCIRWLQTLPTDLDLEKIDCATSFMCINQTCVVSIQTNGYPKYAEIENQEIAKFYSEATFKCHRKYCESQLIANNLLYHLQRCRLGPIDYSFDKTLQLAFLAGPVRDELNRKPKSIASLLPAHLKKQNPPKTIEQYWHEKALGYAFLVKDFTQNPKSITPDAMRAQANFTSGYWNNQKRLRDPTEPIDEAEEFALALGFPSCSKQPIPDVPRRWPTTQCSIIPWYLINESPNWKRWAKYIDIDDASSVSSSSSKVLYAIDIEDPQSPFIRIDPFERLAPSEVVRAKSWLKHSFPSCFNEENKYREPSQPTKPSTTVVVERRRRHLSKSFQDRPIANLPPMMDDQLKVIEELSSNCPDKHLIFSINMFCVKINENGRLRPRPCWVIIVDGNLEVIYETFVRYKEIDHVDARFHGLTVKDLKYARNLNTVRDQVIKYLICARQVIGYGLINHLINLGLNRHEIKELNPKFRDINNFYSPYLEHPMNLHAIAFLWFTGYTLPATPHSPAVEAITAMRLYLLQWLSIEKMANLQDGIHNENCQFTCGNRITSALLYEFDEGIKKGFCHWPEEWKSNPRIRHYPTFNDNCVLPSQFILKKTAEMSRPDYRRQQESQTHTPQSRARRLYQMISAKRSLETSDNESSPKRVTEQPSCSANINQSSDNNQEEKDLEEPIPPLAQEPELDWN